MAVVITLVLGLLATLGVWGIVRADISADLDARFDQAREAITEQLRAGLERYGDAVNQSRAITAVVDDVDRRTWSSSLTSFRLSERLPALTGINYGTHVVPGEEATFLADVRREDPDFRIFPAEPATDFRAVVTHGFPVASNAGAIGFDAATNPLAAGALARARDTGALAMSEVLVLAQDETEQAGLVIYAPIFAGGVDPGTTAQRRADLQAWSMGVFRGQDLLDSINLPTDAVGLVATDVTDATGRPLGVAPAGLDRSAPGRRATQTFELFGQTWSLEFVERDGLADRNEALLATVVGLSGLALTGLLTALAFVMTRAERRALRLVDERTEELADVNTALGAANRRLEESNTELADLNEELGRANQRLEDGNRRLERLIEDHERSNAQLAANNAQISEMNVNLERANRLKSDFLAIVSHEFRTPLTVIRGFASTLLDGTGYQMSEQVHDVIGRIDRNAQRLNSLVEDLLLAARIESGSVDPVAINVDLAMLVRQAVEASTVDAEDVTVDVPDGLAVRADGQLLRLSLSYVLSNATKHGRPPVRVEAATDGEQVTVRVMDAGDGVPAAHHDMIFAQFSQVEDSMTRREQGAGIGLSISRGLTRINGGELLYEDRDDCGACFLFRLPSAVLADESDHASARTRT